MKYPFIVTLDFSSASIKCFIFDRAGKKVATAKKDWQSYNPFNDGTIASCFDVEKTWGEVVSCCNTAISDSQVNPKDIACVITTSQRHGSVLLDKDGKELIAFTNADESFAAPWQEIVEKHGDSIYQISGRWPQKVFLPAHILWLKENQPQIYQRISKILSIQDWLIYKLSKEISSEVTVATDLLLLDIKSGRWSDKLAAYFDINTAFLPKLIEAGDQLGTISEEVAQQTGLQAGTPVLNGAADSQMAMLGLGALEQHSIAVVFGTSIPILMLENSPVIASDGATWTNRHIFNDQWILESNSGDSGLYLNSFLDNLLSFNKYSEKDIPTLLDLDNLAADVEKKNSQLMASVGPVIFNGKKWPSVDGVIKGINLYRPDQIDLPHLYLALIQNIGYAIWGNIKQLEKIAGNHAAQIHIGGPAIESHVWPQLLADIFNRPILIPNEKEITPLGSMILAATKLGLYANLIEAVAEIVKLRQVLPDQESAEFYRQKYEEWRDVYQFSL